MNICLLTDGITPYVTGGMQRHSFNLCNELLKAGNNVTLVHCIDEKSSLPKNEEVKALFENAEHLTVHTIRFPMYGNMPGHYIKESYQYSCAITSLLKDKLHLFDLIYVKGFCGWNLFQQRNKGMVKAGPILVNFHGLEMFQKQASFRERVKAYILKSPAKWNLNQADYCISYGGKITTLLSSVGVPSSQILVIPGAVSDTISLEKRKFPVNSKLLFVGRYERRKGIEELLQVVASMPELEISFVGAIPSSKRINRSNVRYYGEVKDVNTLNEIFDEHTFLIIPSHSEGMPNVILEGMSRGLVSLATDVGAVRELVTSANGIIFEPKSTSAIKSTIETALSLNAWQVESLSTNAMKTIQSKFIWSRIISKTLETFQHVV